LLRLDIAKLYPDPLLFPLVHSGHPYLVLGQLSLSSPQGTCEYSFFRERFFHQVPLDRRATAPPFLLPRYFFFPAWPVELGVFNFFFKARYTGTRAFSAFFFHYVSYAGLFFLLRYGTRDPGWRVRSHGTVLFFGWFFFDISSQPWLVRQWQRIPGPPTPSPGRHIDLLPPAIYEDSSAISPVRPRPALRRGSLLFIFLFFCTRHLYSFFPYGRGGVVVFFFFRAAIARNFAVKRWQGAPMRS